MEKKWNPDSTLIRSGWQFFSLIAEVNITPEYRESMQGRFREILVVKSDYKPATFEIYVKAFPSIPDEQNPGAGFRQVGCRKPGEPITEDYIRQIAKPEAGEVVSTLVLPGPFFAPSVVKGQFERLTEYDRVLWVRRIKIE